MTDGCHHQLVELESVWLQDSRQHPHVQPHSREADMKSELAGCYWLDFQNKSEDGSWFDWTRNELCFCDHLCLFSTADRCKEVQQIREQHPNKIPVSCFTLNHTTLHWALLVEIKMIPLGWTGGYRSAGSRGCSVWKQRIKPVFTSERSMWCFGPQLTLY